MHFKTDLPAISSSLSTSSALSPTITSWSHTHALATWEASSTQYSPILHIAYFVSYASSLGKLFWLGREASEHYPFHTQRFIRVYFISPKSKTTTLVWFLSTAQAKEIHSLVTCFEISDLMTPKHYLSGNIQIWVTDFSFSTKLIFKYMVALSLYPCPVSWCRNFIHLPLFINSF